ncbi:hypothetical protein MBLNU230_g3599t1 [Neophaeotheca triangularis]
MADDTRQSDEPPINKDTLTVNPENKPFAGTQWQGGKQIPYQPPPPQNANMMPGGTDNTAGGKAPEVTIGNAFAKGITWEDFKELPKRPCVRDALMTGIGAGFTVGGIRAIFGAGVKVACNWAVGSACFSSIGMHQYCMYKRQAEKEGMMRAVEILNKKEADKKAREARREKAREERRAKQEGDQDAKFAALKGTEGGNGDSAKPWWKVW